MQYDSDTKGFLTSLDLFAYCGERTEFHSPPLRYTDRALERV